MTSLRERFGALTPYQRFSLFLAGLLLFGAVALSFTIARIIEGFVAQDTAEQTAREVEVHYPKIFGDQIFRRPFSAEELTGFDRIVRFHLEIYDVVRVQMYRTDGTIVYSYDGSQVGGSAFHGSDAELARRAVGGAPSSFVTRASLAQPPPLTAPAATPASEAEEAEEYGRGGSEYGRGDSEYGYANPHASHVAAATAPAPTPVATTAEGPFGNVMRLWVPVHGADGAVVGVAQVDRDIDPTVGAIRRMQLLTTGLVVFVAVVLFLVLRRVYTDATNLLRAREEAERSARVQVAALEELARLKEQFVSQVSHELRGPLAPIVGYAELLADQGLEPAQVQSFAGLIQDGATRLQRLVDDLLDLSRLENGRYRLERRPVALDALLERSVHEAHHLSTQHTITLQMPAELPLADADPDRIAQVVTNLVSNAIRYSPDGREIAVRAAVEAGQLVVSVSDQGIGIPANRLGQVFEKFYRVDNRVTRSVGGTGLGLAISRELVESHGGEIWVESTPGQGSTFSFSLPLAPVSPAAATHAQPGEAAA